jgi:pimeloyl-ACP methyl ester carboxylesterase
MGGMTLMALAEERPELVSERVAGVALVGTSAADLQIGTYDLPAPVAALARRLLPAVGELGVRAERRGLPRYVGPLDRWLLFPRGAEPELVRQALDVHRESSAEVVAAFLPTLSEHDRRAALRALADVPAVVVVGDQDRLCPLAHSQALAAALPSSELTVFPGVGHMVHLERRPEVSAILLGLLDRALTRTG